LEEIFQGKAYVLGNNVDTDQIIPARYLVYNLDDPEERKLYGKYALSGVPPDGAGLPSGRIPFIEQGQHRFSYRVVIAGENFGCGSSREHAPVALQLAGIRIVVAPSYARIFYRNSVDGGYLLLYETKEKINELIATGDEVQIGPDQNRIKNLTSGQSYPLEPLGEVADIVRAGGIFGYARKHGMLR